MALKEIPGSAGFLADTEGLIYNPTGEERNTYRNGDGYVTASIMLNDGRWVTFGVQRLVAMTHVGGRTLERNQVNHRDCDLQNNWTHNLEWVTPSENNVHSEIMRTENLYPTLIARNVTGDIGLYRNAHEAARLLGITALQVWDSVKDGKDVNGVVFLHRPYSGPIPIQMRKTNFPRRNPDGSAPPRAIKTLDIDTGDIRLFTSFAEAAKEYETTASQLYLSIPRHGAVRVFKKKYQVAYIEDDFPEMTLDELDRARNHGKREVVAYHVVEEKYSIYGSAKEFYEMHNLSKKAVTTALAKGVIREIDSWVATYFTPENVAKLKAYIANPVNV